VVGDYKGLDGNEFGFWLVNGTYYRINVPGARMTVPQGINDLNQVVGIYYDSSGSHAFVGTPTEGDFAVGFDMPEPSSLVTAGLGTAIWLGCTLCRILREQRSEKQRSIRRSGRSRMPLGAKRQPCVECG
jgi:hypothetical protein